MTLILVRPTWKARLKMPSPGIASILVAFALLGGCTPRHVRWVDTDALILPQGTRVGTQPPPHGYLVMAKIPGQRPEAEQAERYPLLYLYDEEGHFLEKLADTTEYPKPLHAGDYIVLVSKADPPGSLRQVQVRIEDGRTTTVSLADIDQAPPR